MAMNVLDAHLVNTPKQTRVVARANRVFLVKKGKTMNVLSVVFHVCDGLTDICFPLSLFVYC
jgi:CRISPR/Cas system-associated protein endoribonuclease Cas2